jgi:hypothetical protein
MNIGARVFTKANSNDTSIGTLTRTLLQGRTGEAVLVSKEVVVEPVESYNVIAGGGHMNVFANGILTSTYFNNIRPFDPAGRRFVDRIEASPSLNTSGFAEAGVPARFFKCLRLSEQPVSGYPAEKVLNDLLKRIALDAGGWDGGEVC